jgi:hypothetical protein
MQEHQKSIRGGIAVLAIVVIVWMTFEITTLANDISDFEF